MPMRCACEYDEATRKVLGFCGAHAARARTEQEAEKQWLKARAAEIARNVTAYTDAVDYGRSIADQIMEL